VMARDGAVLAMVGGRDYAKSQFNRAVQAYRQPGSSFKPVVYLTALEHGYTPETLVVDEPIVTGRYRPTNFKNEYYGEVPLYAALAYSLNTISYKLAREIGIGYIIGTARRLGIEADLQRDLSLSLGSSGVPMIQMATAYATIANDGYAVKPYAIRRITDKSGVLIYQRNGYDGSRPMFEPYVIGQLKGMMQGVIDFGTGQGAKFGYPAAGKTGTSQDFRDAWFTGFSDRFIASVWVGNDDNTSMKRVTGGSIPAHIWREVMSAAHQTRSISGQGESQMAFPPSPPDSSLGDSSDFGGLIRRLLEPSSATPAADDYPPPRSSDPPMPVSRQTRERSPSWEFND
ncbi:MAG TPA: penicillin-binding transpeptidase domain-containing protein, partial [Micavibrio sp.]